MASGHILKTEPTGLANELDMGCKQKRGVRSFWSKGGIEVEKNAAVQVGDGRNWEFLLVKTFRHSCGDVKLVVEYNFLVFTKETQTW